VDRNKASETLRFIRCGVADESYGLDMSWVRSIQRLDRFRHNPEARRENADPVGWLSENKGDVPVFSLAGRLGRPVEGGGSLQRIVVLNSLASPLPAGKAGGGQPWAMLVDRVSQVISVPADRVVPLPLVVVNPAASYFQGVIRLGKELILLLSPEHLHPDWRPTDLQPFGYTPLDFARDRQGKPPTLNPESKIQNPKSKIGSRGQIMLFSTTETRQDERPLAYGWSISQVPEILTPLPLVPVPAAPDFVLGLTNWRDRPVPVLDLDARLGMGPGTSRSVNGQARFLIVRDGGDANGGVLGGFVIQPAVRTLRLPVIHQACDRTLPLDQALTRGIVELEQETLVVPDIRRILG
jgi:chemotaxis signal transduction protein